MFVGYALLVIFYLLIFWGVPLSVTKDKSKGHQFTVVLILHGIVGLFASLMPEVK